MTLSSHSAHRLRAVEKYREDLERVKLSDITYPLVMSGYFSKEDLSEILATPTCDQMRALLKVLEGLLNKLPPTKQNEVWECFVWALHSEYAHLALSLALHCDRGARIKRPGKVTKSDIGAPADFKHLVSFTNNSAEVTLTDLNPVLEPCSYPLTPQPEHPQSDRELFSAALTPQRASFS